MGVETRLDPKLFEFSTNQFDPYSLTSDLDCLQWNDLLQC
jgi:hypothetical protein